METIHKLTLGILRANFPWALHRTSGWTALNFRPREDSLAVTTRATTAGTILEMSGTAVPAAVQVERMGLRAGNRG